MSDRKKKIVFLFFIIFFLSLMFLSAESSAQMTIGYPKKFRLTGLIELQYKNYAFETSTDRASHESGYSDIRQRLRLNLEGYVYHPRLIVFRSSVDFSYFKSLTGADTKGRDLGYDLFVTALPYRPVSLDLFASRDHYFFEARTQALPDRTVNHYGARLRINLEKLKPIRLIRLRYEHWDYITEGISEDTKTNSYSLSISGLLSKIKTTYTLTSSLNKLSSPISDIDSKYFNSFTVTGLTKKGTKLITSFFYADIRHSTDDYIKELTFGADLDFPPVKRFYHDYRYVFDTTEQFYKGSESAGTMDKLTESSYHVLTGSWGYRITDRLMSSLALNYGKRRVGDDKGSLTGLSTSLTYRRPFAAYNFESAYRFILRRDDFRDDSNEHRFNIGLRTRRFKLGTAYLTYTLIKTDSESKVFERNEEDFFGEEEEKILIGKRETDTLAHTVLMGLRGRGFGNALRRAIWTVEGSYFNVKSDIKRPIREDEDEFSETEIEHITRKTHQYSFYGQIILPIRSTINFNSRATYTFGETDSVSRQSLIMHTRLNYRIYRNLTFSGLWRGRWDKIESRPDRRIFDYEAVFDYRRGKTIFTLEFYLTSTEEAKINFWSRRIFLTLKRYI